MSRRTQISTSIAVSLTATLALGARPGWSADWEFNPRVELGVLADNNYHLNQPGHHDRVRGLFTNVLLQLRSVGQINEFTFTPWIHATQFDRSNTSSDSSTDPTVEADFTHHGLTYTAGVTGRYADESVARTDRAPSSITGNVTAGGLGNPVGGDSGYLTISDRRQMVIVTPSASFELTQRNHLQFHGDFENVDYDRVIPGYYVGFTNIDGSVGVAHDLSQRSTLTLRVRYNQYNPDLSFSIVDSYGLEGEWGRHVSELAQAYVRVGAMHSHFTPSIATPATADVTNFVGGAGMNWAFQAMQVFLDATEEVQPNATGYSVVRDQLRLRLTKSLSPKFTVIIGGNGYRDRATGNVQQFNDRKLAVGSLGLEWRFLRAWSLTGQYTYTWQKYQADPAAAVSNAALISFVYEPNRRN